MDVCVLDLDTNFANNCWICLLLGAQSATNINPELNKILLLPQNTGFSTNEGVFYLVWRLFRVLIDLAYLDACMGNVGSLSL